MSRVRRSPLPPTITGMSCAGRGYDVVSGSVDAVAVVRLGAGCPERAAGLDRALEEVEPLAAPAGRGRPYAACSRSHHPAPMPRNARPPESGVERGGGLGGEAGRAEGHRGAQGPELESGVEPGDQAQRHPGLGDRLPGGVDLGDLDQVVHQRDPGEARVRRRQRHLLDPRTRVLAPREPGQLQHHPQPVGRQGGRRTVGDVALSGRSRADRHRTVSRLCAGHDLDAVPALADEGVAGGRATRRTCSARAGAGTGRSRRAFRRRHSSAGVSTRTATVGRPAARAASRHAIRRSVSRPSVSTTVVSPREMRAATMRSRRSKASAEASRSAGPEPTMPRRSSEETTSARR